jgi:hypothetical protein
VIVLDENVFASQRVQLRKWRMHLCQIGDDVGRKGMLDGEIIPLLRTIRHPTFVTRDRDFFDKSLCGERYCLVHLDVHPLEFAAYVRRFLRHPDFKTWSQRKGRVVRVSATGIWAWQLRTPRKTRHRWDD